MTNAYIETFTGRKVPLSSAIRPNDIHIMDIMTSLSRINRYIGHTSPRTITVLEHSVIVAELIMARGHTPDLILAGLLHDAKEAYIGDIATPVKLALGVDFQHALDSLEHWIDAAICAAYGLPYGIFDHEVVKQADVDILMLEASKLVHSKGMDWTFSRPVTYQLGEIAWEEYWEDMGSMSPDKLIDFTCGRFNTLVKQVEELQA